MTGARFGPKPHFCGGIAGGPPPLHAARRLRLRPPVGADDTNLLLGIATEPQLGCGEQPIDDHVVALDAVVHKSAPPCAPITQSGGISPWPMPAGNSMNTCRPSSKARSGRHGGSSPSIR